MSAYQAGDFVKAEFKDSLKGESEWMWVRVERADDEQRLIFGSLDSQPLLDYGGKLKLGSQLAISYENIREHKKALEF
jgi:hypothetical protein